MEGLTTNIVVVRIEVHIFDMGCSTLEVNISTRLRPCGFSRKPMYITHEPW